MKTTQTTYFGAFSTSFVFVVDHHEITEMAQTSLERGLCGTCYAQGFRMHVS